MKPLKSLKTTCTVEGCNKENNSHGLCASHAARRRRGQEVETPLKDVRLPIYGKLPQNGEKAIYYLRRQDGVPFYVGSSNVPNERLSRHRYVMKEPKLEMVIVRCCPAGEEVYWESKTLVELVESGRMLINTVAPILRSENRNE